MPGFAQHVGVLSRAGQHERALERGDGEVGAPRRLLAIEAGRLQALAQWSQPALEARLHRHADRLAARRDLERGGGHRAAALEGRRLEAGGEQVAAAVAHLVRAKPSPADAVEALAGLLAAGLEASSFERGCPVATTALEVTPRSEPIRAAVQASFESWLAPLRERLEATGFGPDEAGRRADLTIAALEGALVLARARQNADVLREAGRQLRPFLQPPED